MHGAGPAEPTPFSRTTKEHTVKILVAVDGSPYTQKALELSHHQSHDCSARAATVLVLVCTGHHWPTSRAMSPRTLPTATTPTRPPRCSTPSRPTSTAQGITELRGQLRHGQRAEEIVEAAKDCGAGLIVMGTHGHGMFGRALMGSVATKVIAESPVSVLLVK